MANRFTDLFSKFFFSRALAKRSRGSASYDTRPINNGGIASLAGMGGANDKAAGTFFQPTRVYWRSPLEILYAQSWAAKKAMRLPVDDGLMQWREWADGETEGAAEKMMMAEERHKVRKLLADAMVAGSVFGTAVAVLVTKEAPLTDPLMPERIRPGDLSAIHVFDRFDLSVISREADLFSPMFQQPTHYHITPSRTGGSVPFDVHASRCLRFDGIAPLTSAGWLSYDPDFGISELVPLLTSLLQDETLATGIAHLSQEASIPTLKVDNLAEKAAGMVSGDEMSLDQIGETFNRTKSIWRVAMIDKSEEEFERVAVQFGGLADLMSRFPERIAAAADIPQTRFMGRSPAGMNSTGEGDDRAYWIMVEAKRAMRLLPILGRLDMVLARDAGLAEPPPFKWLSMIQTSELERAQAAYVLTQTYDMAIRANMMIEDEGRRQLDGHPVFGALPEMEMPEPEPEPGLTPDPDEPEGD